MPPVAHQRRMVGDDTYSLASDEAEMVLEEVV
jgi:hypothetical protein